MKSHTSLTHTSIEDCRSGIVHATTASIRAAIEWCRENPAGQKTRIQILERALKQRDLSAETAAHLPPQKTGTLPDDLTLLKTSHVHDLARIASVAPLAALQEASRWAAQSLPADSPRRRAIEMELASRKGGRP